MKHTARKHMLQLEQRLTKVAKEKPTTLLEAMQLIFAVHACLHLTGEPVSVGRLDVLLAPFTKVFIINSLLTSHTVTYCLIEHFGECGLL